MAALAALKDQDFIDKSIENNIKGKGFLYSSFEEMGLEYIPTHANFLMVRVNLSSTLVFKELLKKGVIIRSGDIYGMDDWIRVTIGTEEENELFIRALKEVIGDK